MLQFLREAQREDFYYIFGLPGNLDDRNKLLPCSGIQRLEALLFIITKREMSLSANQERKEMEKTRLEWKVEDSKVMQMKAEWLEEEKLIQ
ncbi:hypothetical protein ACS0TY_004721 [Phlomoides rotata]